MCLSFGAAARVALVIGQILLFILRPAKTIDCEVEDDTCYWLYILIMLVTTIIIYVYALYRALCI